MRRGLYIVFGLLLLIVLVGVGWWLYNRMVEYEQTEVVEESVKVEERLFGRNEAIPINKTMRGSGEYVTYVLVGELVDPFIQNGPLLEGQMVLRDDPAKRQFKIQVGDLDGNVLFGEYSESFDSGVTYSIVPAEQVIEVVQPGMPIKLTAIVFVDKYGEGDDFEKELEASLDALRLDWEAGEYSYELPPQMVPYGSKLGVVR